MNQDYSAILKLYPISDSSVNFEGYSISSKGFLPTVQFSSVAQSYLTLWDPLSYNTPSLSTHPNSWSLLMSIKSVMPSNCPSLCRPLLLLPSIFPRIRVFSNESALHIRWSSIGVSASASVLAMNIQDWFPLGWTGWISFQSKGFSRVFSNTTVQKHQFFSTQLSL